MWTWKKQRRLTASLSRTHSRITSTAYKTKLLRKLGNMPYDRKTGMSIRADPRRTIRNELNSLKRRIGKNESAPVYFNKTQPKIPSTATGVGSYPNPTDVSITGEFIASSGFRDLINGDQFYNVNLTVSGVLDTQCENMRIVIYSPRKTSNGPVLGTGDIGLFHNTYDPSAFKVYSDRYINRGSSALEAFRYFVNLRSLKTTYNDSAATLEEGEIRMSIYTYMANTSANTNTQVRTFLCCKDK